LSRFSSLNLRPRKYFCGLDIGYDDIKLLQLSGRGPGLAPDQLQLEHYACANLQAGVISDDGIDDLEQLIDTLRSLLEGGPIPPHQIALGIPPTLCVTTRQPITDDASRTADQLQALATTLAAEVLPYPANEAGIDFCTLPATGTAQQTSIFITATRLEIIEDLLAMSEALGLQAIALDISTYAAYAAWRQIDSTVTIAAGQVAGLLHLDARQMHCTLFEGLPALPGQTHYAPASATDVRLMARDALALVRQALTQTAATGLTHLVLSGTAASMEGLSAAIQRCLQPDTMLVTCLPAIRLATTINAAQWQMQTPAYLAAYGLALRSVNA
jgi:Tfp pilus assembly PilM family ATPase